MKKKTLIGISSIVILVLVILVGGYTVYNKAGDYLVEQTLKSQITEDFTQQTGIDLSESGRELTKEEVETVKVLPKIKEQTKNSSTKRASNKQLEKEVITTDDLKEALQKEVKEVVNVIPSKDKRAMISLVMSNLASGDINYLMSLVLDGVSSSDLAEAKRIAKERFDGTELKVVQEYYDQYKHLLP